jgi:hypothetical protein
LILDLDLQQVEIILESIKNVFNRLQWRRLGKICGCAKIKSQLELVCFLKKIVLKSTK